MTLANSVTKVKYILYLLILLHCEIQSLNDLPMPSEFCEK